MSLRGGGQPLSKCVVGAGSLGATVMKSSASPRYCIQTKILTSKDEGVETWEVSEEKTETKAKTMKVHLSEKEEQKREICGRYCIQTKVLTSQDEGVETWEVSEEKRTTKAKAMKVHLSEEEQQREIGGRIKVTQVEIQMKDMIKNKHSPPLKVSEGGDIDRDKLASYRKKQRKKENTSANPKKSMEFTVQVV